MRPGCSVPPLPHHAVGREAGSPTSACSPPLFHWLSSFRACRAPWDDAQVGSAHPSRALRSPGGSVPLGTLHPGGTGARARWPQRPLALPLLSSELETCLLSTYFFQEPEAALKG